MEDPEYLVLELLNSCIGTRIIGIYEEDYAVFLYLSDGQKISISVLEDGGFVIDVQPELLH